MGDNVVKSYITNVLNSLFSVRTKALASFTSEMYVNFDSQLRSAATIFYLLLSVYLALVTCQYFLGFLLLKAVYSEEELFLRVPAKSSRRLQALVNEYMNSVRVSFLVLSLINRLTDSTTRTKLKPRQRP